jgi:hypothetical protein
MISLDDYKLTYYEIETGKIYRARRPETHRYILLDPITGEKTELTRHELNKRFKSHENNKEIVKENFRRCKVIFA